MEPVMTPEQIAELLSRKLEDAEESDSHRRGHWFESSIAHHFYIVSKPINILHPEPEILSI